MRYLSHVDKYLTLKYKYKYKYSGHKHKYKYKYFKMVLEYYSSTSTSTKYYISGTNLSADLMIVAGVVLACYQRVTDGRTDTQNLSWLIQRSA